MSRTPQWQRDLGWLLWPLLPVLVLLAAAEVLGDALALLVAGPPRRR